MSVIKIENLGKKYMLSHQRKEPYFALRDVLTESIRNIGKMLLKPVSNFNSTQSKEEFWALKDIYLDIQQGEKVGIIGRNGAGKSTLLKILSRIVEPTTGRVGIKGRVASLLEVGTGFHPELTGRENIFLNGAILGMTKSEIVRKFDEIVDFAEVEQFLDTPVKRFSSGMYVRLAFAVAAHLEPEILLIDEVLAVGDAQFQKKCFGKMEDVSSKEGKTIIFVSHNMQAVRLFCQKGLMLNRGENILFGSIDDVLKNYEALIMSGLSSGGSLPGLLYDNSNVNLNAYDIVRVMLCDSEGKPTFQISTFDNFKIRIIFHSPVEKKYGSVAVVFATADNNSLLRCAMRPDSGFNMDFKVGINEVIFHVEDFPLPSGQYILRVGLSDPPREWLMTRDLCVFEVGMRDVFNSGFPPSDRHTSIVAKYGWEIV